MADSGNNPGAKPTTVLVVDDIDAVRAVTVEFLRSQRYHVLEASSGAQALAIAAQFEGTIAAVVSDVNMPGMEGTELARRLLESRPELKFVFLSGYADEDAGELRELRRKGARFLSKPLSMRALAAELSALLR